MKAIYLNFGKLRVRVQYDEVLNMYLLRLQRRTLFRWVNIDDYEYWVQEVKPRKIPKIIRSEYLGIELLEVYPITPEEILDIAINVHGQYINDVSQNNDKRIKGNNLMAEIEELFIEADETIINKNA